ncbi:threonine aldolase family protein [Desulfuribacillus alkaliarsenatis]|uniref:Threonine aldolase n=1 Tax=Desulfuribacillus alkaliarsenatis TaxID=766136 RepID=A0A1E5G0W0_9FIRM|nr:low specificity L-threonine aldolase [Desulfuribacillus alkaliarsenatis]OEF96545.1 threonine aldolase [Desulfuribacillus alkaliarsenatis]
MIRFTNDYSEGAHPKILEKLLATNMEQTPGYGEDVYCQQAASLIKEKCKNDNIDVHFLVGGTQTNLTVIAASLRPHQGVIAAESGHISTHETGAIEATGHKVLELPTYDGKLTARQIYDVYINHQLDETHEHTVQPKMVYISNPTELGTIYTRSELEAISNVCRENGLYLFLDGARLGYGLTSSENDMDLAFITECCDVFYIGGTKIGALFGEAVVITNDTLKQDFRYIMKQRGGLLAKGRLLGIQFLTLFENDLYFELSAYANKMANIIKEALQESGCTFLISTSTNQLFPILPNETIEALKKHYSFLTWQRIDDKHSAVRFCTSWATKEEDVLRLISDLKGYYDCYDLKR